jgi:hypothetical protein
MKEPSTMSEQPDNQDEFGRRPSFLEDLSKFPGTAEDSPPPPLPNRARTWGCNGALVGAVCGSVMGMFVFLDSLLSGSPSLGEAIGIFFGAPVVLGALSGIIWGIRGAIQDRIMESRDFEKQVEAERREYEDREWHAVKHILKRQKEDG